MAIDLTPRHDKAYLQQQPGSFVSVPVKQAPARADINVLQADSDDMPEVDDTDALHRSLKDKITGEHRPRVRELAQQENLKFRDTRRLNKKPDRSYLITMRFSNGTRRSWVIVTKNEFFKYRKRMYYLMYENAYYDLTQHCYHLDYFDDYVCPIDRKILLLEDKTAAVGKEKAFFATSPSNIKNIVKMEYVKALADSQSLSKYMKFLVIINMAGILISAVALYLITSLPKKLSPIIAQLVLAAVKASTVVKP